MRQIIEIILINRCLDCKYRHWKPGLPKNICGQVFQAEIPDANQIPDWCPLEDYKEN